MSSNRRKKKGKKQDPYQKMADKMIPMILNSDGKWLKTWIANADRNGESGYQYKGIWNQLALAIAAHENEYTDRRWLTRAAMKRLSEKSDKFVHIKKGQSGTPILMAFNSSYTTTNKDGEKETKSFPKFRAIYVWNVAQTTAELPPVKTSQNKDNDEEEVSEKAKAIISKFPSKLSNIAAFVWKIGDKVNGWLEMPARETFISNAEFYHTYFHEICHFVIGTKTKMNFEYADEEVIVHLAATFICDVCEISDFDDKNGAAYIKGWLSRVNESDQQTALINAIKTTKKVCDAVLKESNDNGEKENDS